MRFWSRAIWATCLVALPLLWRIALATGVQDEETSDSSEAADQSPISHKQQQRPLRPALSFSERVMPIQLVDSSSGGLGRLPRRRHLRMSALMSALGEDLDPARMSVNKPAVLVEGPDYETAPAGPPPRALAGALRALNLSQEVGTLSEALTAKMEAWLLRKASCPVRHVWEDVGALFWPRWVKRGECVNAASRRSCSWPPGMLCVPAESVIVHLLRWHCRPRSRRSTQPPSTSGSGSGSGRPGGGDPRHFRCQWLKVPYPVTDKCFCSC